VVVHDLGTSEGSVVLFFFLHEFPSLSLSIFLYIVVIIAVVAYWGRCVTGVIKTNEHTY
jgi:hypothetical protein